MQRYNLKKLNDVELKEYQFKIPSRFAALENGSSGGGGGCVKRVWEGIRVQKLQPQRI
jgi:hypothetical protein